MKALLVDFNNLWNRYYYAFQGNTDSMHNRLYNILSNLHYSFYYRKKFLVIDGKNSITNKLLLFPDYKGGRCSKNKVYETMPSFLRKVKNDFKSITICCANDFEADEVISVLSYRLSKNDFNTYIYSNDKDLLQLLAYSPLIHIGTQFTSGLEITPFSQEEVLNRFKIPLPSYSHILKFRVFRGDTSDKIPPIVPRMSSKNVLSLIDEFWKEPTLTPSVIQTLHTQNPKILPSILERNWNLMYLNPHIPLSSMHILTSS